MIPTLCWPMSPICIWSAASLLLVLLLPRDILAGFSFSNDELPSVLILVGLGNDFIEDFYTATLEGLTRFFLKLLTLLSTDSIALASKSKETTFPGVGLIWVRELPLPNSAILEGLSLASLLSFVSRISWVLWEVGSMLSSGIIFSPSLVSSKDYCLVRKEDRP